MRREIKHLLDDEAALQRRADRLRGELEDIEAAFVELHRDARRVDHLSQLGDLVSVYFQQVNRDSLARFRAITRHF